MVSLGCPKNRVDTEVMLGAVDRAGYQIVDDPERAEVIVVNTCGFIGPAAEESVDTILELAEYKRAGSCRKLVVTGCLTQRHPDELAAELPEVDHILGSGDFAHIADVLDGRDARRLQVADTPEYLYDHTTPRLPSGPVHSVYVKIAEGCDRPCAFCIIPQLRGPQRSRAVDSVVAEVARLAAAGAREINLVAQDLTRYGVDRPERPTLAQLVRAVARVDGVRWVRLHYTYPTAFTDELIDAIADEPNVAKYVDVPLQHIDDGVLKKMRRGHGGKAARELVDRLRARIPGVVLRTTFITGHPGETDAAFDALCAFVREVEFDHVGVFPFCREQGTVSALLPGRVPRRVAEQRRDALLAIQRDISAAKLRAMVGREIDVLVDGLSDETDLLLQGRWQGQAPEVDGCVYLTDGTAQPGDLVRARVTDSADYDLAASIL
ncbi:MAG: 30S ribosomal protein S12 methylthiotransferase RimO [Deltaproteobacteria bacterium]|nr:MAG: 30S ribosomal protein S12 methylthiotransferase RimO [Deltaproteobacteria bacterium]